MKKRSSMARAVTKRRICATAQVPPFFPSPLMFELALQGTTGKPKGVEVTTFIIFCDATDRFHKKTTHQNVTTVLDMIQATFLKLTFGVDCLLGILPFYHIYGTPAPHSIMTIRPHSSCRQHQTLALPLVLRNSRRHTIPFRSRKILCKHRKIQNYHSFDCATSARRVGPTPWYVLSVP
jgi:hypothetical protein